MLSCSPRHSRNPVPFRVPVPFHISNSIPRSGPCSCDLQVSREMPEESSCIPTGPSNKGPVVWGRPSISGKV